MKPKADGGSSLSGLDRWETVIWPRQNCFKSEEGLKIRLGLVPISFSYGGEMNITHIIVVLYVLTFF